MPAEAVLPAEPLLTAIRARGGVRACVGRDYALERAYSRARQIGQVTPWAADRLAVRVLGLHPVAVWGEVWWGVPLPRRLAEIRQTRSDRVRPAERPSWWRKVQEQQRQAIG